MVSAAGKISGEMHRISTWADGAPAEPGNRREAPRVLGGARV